MGTPADARNVPDIGVVYGADIRFRFSPAVFGRGGVRERGGDV